MKVVEVTVAKDGEVTVEAQGFAGASCYEATRPIEAALGTVTDDKRTADYSREPRAVARQQ